MTAISMFATSIIWLLANSLPAQFTETTLVTKDYRQRGVLKLNCFFENVRSSGTGTMHVNVTNVMGPSKSDRQLVIAFQNKSGNPQQSILYRRPLLLPEGSTSVSLEIPSFATADDYCYGRVVVFEDGRNIVDDEATNLRGGGTPGTFSRFYGNTASPLISDVNTIIASKESLSDADTTLGKLLDSTSGGVARPPLNKYLSASNLQRSVDMSKRARWIGEASTDWRYYYGSGSFVVTAECLEELLTDRPDVADCLRTFVISGGTVHVQGSTIEQARLVIDRWLDGQPSRDGARYWLAQDEIPEQEIDVGTGSSTTMFPLGANPTIIRSAQSTKTKVKPKEKPKPIPTDLPPKKYEFRHFFLGNVVAYSDARVVLGLTAQQISSGYDGGWFWRNLILSVGKPPVWTFGVLVTLFSCLIGPGTLYATGRLKRRSLLIVLVPVLSLVATSLIVAYSVLHEGFETSIRINGVIAVDSKTGNGFAWSRQNYFSGLPPRSGLQFDAATYVRPVVDDDSRYRYPSNPFHLVSTYVDLTDDKQIWRNWLRSRQQQQMLVGHQVKVQAPISCQASVDGSTAVLRNLTDELLPVVIVRGDGDQYYLAEGLAAGAELTVSADHLESARVLASRARQILRPETPPELAIASNSLLNFATSSRFRYANVVSTSDVEVINNVYARFLSNDLMLSPRSFVTAIKDARNIEVPLQGNIVESSILVVGSLP